MIQRILFTVLLIFLVLPLLWSQEYYTVRGTGASTTDLEVVDMYNGNVLSSVGVNLPGTTIDGYGGLAYNPANKKLYVVIQSGTTSKFCTLNPNTGAASFIKDLPDRIGSITCAPNGTVWGITADDAGFPYTIYKIDKSSGAAAFFTVANGGGIGEAIAYDTVASLIYRYGGNGLLQTIDPNTKAVDDVSTNIGNLPNGDCSMFYVGADDEFLLTAGKSIYTMDKIGVYSKLSDDDAEEGFTGIVLKELVTGTGSLHPPLSVIRIYPNPATDHLQIKLPKKESAQVQIIDPMGRTVLKQSVLHNESLDIANLSNGIYVLSVNQGMLTEEITFIKQ